MKKFFLIKSIYFLFLLVISAQAFSDPYDSLLKELSKVSDRKEKVRLLLSLSEICPENEILNYAIPAFEEAEKINLPTEQAGSANNIAFAYMMAGERSKAQYYYRKSMGIWIKLKNAEGVSTSLVNLGYLFQHYYNDSEKALYFFKASLEFCKATRNRLRIADNLNNIGAILKNQGKIEEALEAYGESLKLREEEGDKKGVAQSLINLGDLYGVQNKDSNAIENYRRALDIHKAGNNPSGMAFCHNNIGQLLENRGHYESALHHLQRADSLWQLAGDKQGAFYARNNLAMLYSYTGKEQLALRLLRQIVQEGKIHPNNKILAFCYNNLGYIYSKKEKLDSAEYFSAKALDLAKKGGFPLHISNAAERLSAIYAARGNYRGAYEMQLVFKKMSDSLRNSGNQEAMARQQTRYIYEKQRALQKKDQEKKDAVARKELEKQKTLRNTFIAGFGIMLLLAAVIYKSYREKKLANEIIARQKKEVETQKSLIEEKQTEIMDSLYYARRIQKALITSEKYIEKNLGRLTKLK